MHAPTWRVAALTCTPLNWAARDCRSQAEHPRGSRGPRPAVAIVHGSRAAEPPTAVRRRQLDPPLPAGRMPTSASRQVRPYARSVCGFTIILIRSRVWLRGMASLDGYNVGAPGAPLLGLTMTRLEQLTVLQYAIRADRSIGGPAPLLCLSDHFTRKRSLSLAFSRVTNCNLTVGGGQHAGAALHLCRNLKELEYAYAVVAARPARVLTQSQEDASSSACGTACPGTNLAGPALRRSPKHSRTLFRPWKR